MDFLILTLSSYMCRIHPIGLEYTSYGKPNPFVFQNAESALRELARQSISSDAKTHQFKKLYMIGDNPAVDINGARKVRDFYSPPIYLDYLNF